MAFASAALALLLFPARQAATLVTENRGCSPTSGEKHAPVVLQDPSPEIATLESRKVVAPRALDHEEPQRGDLGFRGVDDLAGWIARKFTARGDTSTTVHVYGMGYQFESPEAAAIVTPILESRIRRALVEQRRLPTSSAK